MYRRRSSGTAAGRRKHVAGRSDGGRGEGRKDRKEGGLYLRRVEK